MPPLAGGSVNMSCSPGAKVRVSAASAGRVRAGTGGIARTVQWVAESRRMRMSWKVAVAPTAAWIRPSRVLPPEPRSWVMPAWLGAETLSSRQWAGKWCWQRSPGPSWRLGTQDCGAMMYSMMLPVTNSSSGRKMSPSTALTVPEKFPARSGVPLTERPAAISPGGRPVNT